MTNQEIAALNRADLEQAFVRALRECDGFEADHTEVAFLLQQKETELARVTREHDALKAMIEDHGVAFCGWHLHESSFESFRNRKD